LALKNGPTLNALGGQLGKQAQHTKTILEKSEKDHRPRNTSNAIAHTVTDDGAAAG